MNISWKKYEKPDAMTFLIALEDENTGKNWEEFRSSMVRIRNSDAFNRYIQSKPTEEAYVYSAPHFTYYPGAKSFYAITIKQEAADQFEQVLNRVNTESIDNIMTSLNMPPTAPVTPKKR